MYKKIITILTDLKKQRVWYYDNSPLMIALLKKNGVLDQRGGDYDDLLTDLQDDINELQTLKKVLLDNKSILQNENN